MLFCLNVQLQIYPYFSTESSKTLKAQSSELKKNDAQKQIYVSILREIHNKL